MNTSNGNDVPNGFEMLRKKLISETLRKSRVISALIEKYFIHRINQRNVSRNVNSSKLLYTVCHSIAAREILFSTDWTEEKLCNKITLRSNLEEKSMSQLLLCYTFS